MPPAQNVPPGILDWVYSAGDMTLDQHTNMKSPLFVDGNLTLRNTPEIHGRLYVDGNLHLDNSSDIMPTANIAVAGMTTHSKGIGAIEQARERGAPAGRLPGARNVRLGCRRVSYVNPAKRDQIMPPRPVTLPTAPQLELLVPGLLSRPDLELRRCHQDRAAARLRQQLDARSRHRRQRARHLRPDARYELHLQDARGRALVERRHEEAHGQGNDLHRRQRDGH